MFSCVPPIIRRRLRSAGRWRIIGLHRQDDDRDATDQRAFCERWEKWPGDPPAGGEIEEFIDDISGLTGVTPRPEAPPPGLFWAKA